VQNWSDIKCHELRLNWAVDVMQWELTKGRQTAMFSKSPNASVVIRYVSETRNIGAFYCRESRNL